MKTIQFFIRKALPKKNSLTGAYFTVEAAMVLPMVIGVLVLQVYLMLFQYDRCLMELDAGTLALRGCTIQEEDKETLMQCLLENAALLDEEKYLSWINNDEQIELTGGKVCVRKSGNLYFPFSELQIGSANEYWSATAEYENRCISPVSFIRTWRKLGGE